MNYFDTRLQDVSSYFTHGDVHLGYRRLLDAAIETGNFDVYAATLLFCDWYDGQGNAKDHQLLNQKVQDLRSRTCCRRFVPAIKKTLHNRTC